MARFSEEVREGLCIVHVAGDLDLAAVEDFVQVGQVSLTRCDAVDVDLGEVSFIDSSGLGALVRLRKEADEQGTSLTLSNVSVATERLLQLTGLADVFDLPASQA